MVYIRCDSVWIFKVDDLAPRGISMHQHASATPTFASSKVSDVVKVHNLLGEPIDEDEETPPLNATNLD